jgi:hypothetical protein
MACFVFYSAQSELNKRPIIFENLSQGIHRVKMFAFPSDLLFAFMNDASGKNCILRFFFNLVGEKGSRIQGFQGSSGCKRHDADAVNIEVFFCLYSSIFSKICSYKKMTPRIKLFSIINHNSSRDDPNLTIRALGKK